MVDSLGRVLLVDDEPDLREMCGLVLSREGYEVQTVASAEEALDLLRGEEFEAILLDLRMKGMDGLTFLRRFKEENHPGEVVVQTAYATVETAVEAMKRGAFGYVSKPFNAAEVLAELGKAVEVHRLRQENRLLKSGRQKGLSGMVGEHESMQRVKELIRQVAPTGVSVVIEGESGTGKQLVAEAIHERSHRTGKFVVCNCAALAPGVLESELFGHVKGAFSGAVKDTKGRFEEADGGTLFLDEVGDLTQEMQIPLLRVLQEGEFEPVGSTTTKRVDVRVVAATHRDLEAAVREGEFREDLYYRLNAVTIRVPPLRERRSDIPLLCGHILRCHEAVGGGRRMSLTAEAMGMLEAYEWRGNVRELENVLTRSAVLCKDGTIGIRDLPDSVCQRGRGGRPEDGDLIRVGSGPFHEARAQFEQAFIRRALCRTGGNVSRAAEETGMPRRTLQRKMEEHQIEPRSCGQE